MAQIENLAAGKKGFRSSAALRIDMTPMVDLGFLLITFFIFTSVVQKPTSMLLTVPKDSDSSSLTAETKTLTVLLGADDVAVCYDGIAAENAVTTTVKIAGGCAALRERILSKQHQLSAMGASADSMVVIIRPGPESSYGNMVAVLDEMTVCNVKKHAIGPLEPSDKKLLYRQH